MKKYKIIKTQEEFRPCNKLWEEIETNDIEQSMNDFAEDLNETATYDIDDMTVSDKWGNEFKFIKVVEV